MQDIIANNEYLNGNRTNSLINRKMIFRILGILLFIEGVMFLVCAGVSLCYKEHSYIYFIYSTLITAVAGAVLVFLGRKAENKLRAATVIVLLLLLGFYLHCSGCFLFI